MLNAKKQKTNEKEKKIGKVKGSPPPPPHPPRPLGHPITSGFEKKREREEIFSDTKMVSTKKGEKNIPRIESS